MAKKIGLKTKTPMPCADPKERSRTFSEVALGYTEQMALQEADRCIMCKNRPCVAGCPVEIDIPTFIQQMAKSDFQGAFNTMMSKNVLPAICGRVCPQEEQCEKVCNVADTGKYQPVAIGRMERFAADWEAAQGTIEPPVCAAPTGKKVAVVGAGPAGLTVAGDLLLKGHEITVFEALHGPGGVLLYGIPEFRLPKAIVEAEVEYLRKLGVKIETNFVIGRTNS